MSLRLASASIAGAMLLLACTSTLPTTAPDPYPPPASPAPDDPFTVARTAPDAPEEIRAVPGVTSCGTIVLALSRALPRESTDCLERSMGAARAELAVAQHTDEGDLIVTFYLTYPDSTGYDVVVDQRQDSFSNGGFARYRCAGAKTLHDPAAGCAERWRSPDRAASPGRATPHLGSYKRVVSIYGARVAGSAAQPGRSS